MQSGDTDRCTLVARTVAPIVPRAKGEREFTNSVGEIKRALVEARRSVCPKREEASRISRAVGIHRHNEFNASSLFGILWPRINRSKQLTRVTRVRGLFARSAYVSLPPPPPVPPRSLITLWTFSRHKYRPLPGEALRVERKSSSREEETRGDSQGARDLARESRASGFAKPDDFIKRPGRMRRTYARRYARRIYRDDL